MEYEIRTIGAEEFQPFRRCLARAFHGDFDSARVERSRALFEFDRNLAAFDRGDLIGTAGAFSTSMSVPGGNSLPVAAVTMVSVAATHRRRGIASALMRRQLEQICERDEPIAALWATESSIYGRFGYGIATHREALSVPRPHAALRSDLAAAGGQVRLLDVDEARAVLPRLHESLRRRRPGELERSDQWWELRIFDDVPEFRDGFTANEYLLYEEADGPAGYVRYRAKSGWDDGNPSGILAIQELYAASPEARVALWRFLCSVDLIGAIQQDVAEVDDPLLAMLVDSRRVVRRTYDAIWLRLIDVEKALSGRALAVDGRVRFQLHDALGLAAGRFEIEGGPGGSVCRRTTAPAEFELGPEELGQAYLGGGRLRQMHAVGRIEGDMAAIARADAMLRWFDAPHCQEHF